MVQLPMEASSTVAAWGLVVEAKTNGIRDYIAAFPPIAPIPPSYEEYKRQAPQRQSDQQAVERIAARCNDPKAIWF